MIKMVLCLFVCLFLAYKETYQDKVVTPIFHTQFTEELRLCKLPSNLANGHFQFPWLRDFNPLLSHHALLQDLRPGMSGSWTKEYKEAVGFSCHIASLDSSVLFPSLLERWDIVLRLQRVTGRFQ